MQKEVTGGLPLKGVPFPRYLTNSLIVSWCPCNEKLAFSNMMLFTFPQEHSNIAAPNHTVIPETLRQNKPSHF